MRRSRLQPVHGYCATVSILGLGMLAGLLVGSQARKLDGRYCATLAPLVSIVDFFC
jgi:hypothetical protein